MKKTKYLLVLLIIISMMLFVPNMVNAETLKYEDKEQNIDWTYIVDDKGNIIDLKCTNTGVVGNVKIPEKIDNKPVVSLKETFRDCAGITNVEIPRTITKIGNNTFKNCTGIKSITLPNSITSIGDSAFLGCSGLQEIKFSTSLSSIGEYAFENCKGLKGITIPDSVTKLSYGAFYGCSGLKEVNLSSNLSSIEGRVFEGCSGLTEIKLPESITSIAGASFGSLYAPFGGCTNLRKILIPDSVASIGNNAFYKCNENLTIYGHDGQASKTFAEENKIKFDYIENWDKPVAGSDVTKPTVSSIIIPYAYHSKLKTSNDMCIAPTGTKLALRVNFSEEIKGSKVPTLTIKFGSGSNIKITEGTLAGSSITYEYTVKSSDKGSLTAVEVSGRRYYR